MATREEIVEALERIAKDDEDGGIAPEAVVEAARDVDSPLHDRFDWDDSSAAHQFRLEQARKLITQYPITIVRPDPQMVNVVITRDDGSSRRVYVPIDRAVADPDLYEQVVADAKRGIQAYRNRLSAFERAREVVTRLDEALREL
jgi:hypothetical protein